MSFPRIASGNSSSSLSVEVAEGRKRKGTLMERTPSSPGDQFRFGGGFVYPQFQDGGPPSTTSTTPTTTALPPPRFIFQAPPNNTLHGLVVPPSPPMIPRGPYYYVPSNVMMMPTAPPPTTSPPPIPSNTSPSHSPLYNSAPSILQPTTQGTPSPPASISSSSSSSFSTLPSKPQGGLTDKEVEPEKEKEESDKQPSPEDKALEEKIKGIPFLFFLAHYFIVNGAP